MALIDKDHPLWKTTQTFFAVVGIGILVWHLEHGASGVDADAVVAGGGGLAVASKLLWQSLKG